MHGLPHSCINYRGDIMKILKIVSRIVLASFCFLYAIDHIFYMDLALFKEYTALTFILGLLLIFFLLVFLLTLKDEE